MEKRRARPGPFLLQRSRGRVTSPRSTRSAIRGARERVGDLPELATKLAFLTDWLYADMLEEECSLLNPDVVRDDQEKAERALRVSAEELLLRLVKPGTARFARGIRLPLDAVAG